MSDRAPRQARVDLSADPLVYFIDDFADEDSCDHLIRQARPSLGGAEVQTRRGSAAPPCSAPLRRGAFSGSYGILRCQ